MRAPLYLKKSVCKVDGTAIGLGDLIKVLPTLTTNLRMKEIRPTDKMNMKTIYKLIDRKNIDEIRRASNNPTLKASNKDLCYRLGLLSEYMNMMKNIDEIFRDKFSVDEKKQKLEDIKKFLDRCTLHKTLMKNVLSLVEAARVVMDDLGGILSHITCLFFFFKFYFLS